MLVTYPRDGRIRWVWEQYGRQWILCSGGDVAAGGKGECVVSWCVLAVGLIEFARKAARAGVDVRLRVEPDGFHVYVLGVPIIPEAVAALDRSARLISWILTQG